MTIPINLTDSGQRIPACLIVTTTPQHCSAVSENGSLVAFLGIGDATECSNTNPPPQFGCQQMYARDVGASRTYLLSQNASGQAGDNASYTPYINPNGSAVSFTSLASNLVVDDTNDCTHSGPPYGPSCADVFVAHIAPVVSPHLIGDANCDGVVNQHDVPAVLDEAVGLTQTQPTCAELANVNCDNVVDARDALRILLFLVDLPLPQPSGCPEIDSPA